MKKLGIGLGIAWGIFCLLCGVACILINKYGANHIAIITNYLGANTQVSVVDKNLDPDTAYTMVVNYYENKDNSGVELFEIKLTSYTDYLMQGVYSTGIQIINPSSMTCEVVSNGFEWDFFGGKHYNYRKYKVTHSGDIYYFNSVDGYSFNASDELKSASHDLYIVDIDGSPYAFNFDKRVYDYNYTFAATSYNVYDSSFDYFKYQVYEAVKSLKEDGTYLNMPLKFDDVFKLYEYNSSTGEFDIQSTKGYSQEYFHFKFNKYNRGAVIHEDSVFDVIGDYSTGGVIWGK